MEKGLDLWPVDIRIHGLAKGFFKRENKEGTIITKKKITR